jgi:hypothetical protein
MILLSTTHRGSGILSPITVLLDCELLENETPGKWFPPDIKEFNVCWLDIIHVPQLGGCFNRHKSVFILLSEASLNHATNK